MTTTKTNNELARIVKAWTNKDFTHLFLDGLPGSGKTTIVRDEADVKAGYIKSASPFELYKLVAMASQTGHEYVIIDDLDVNLFRNGRGADLMKQLLNPEIPRTVEWNSSRTGRGKTPSSFETKLRICIITNYIGQTNEHAKAIRDRCFCVTHLLSGKEALRLSVEYGITPKTFVDKLREVAPEPLYLSLRKIKHLYTTYKLKLDWEKDYVDYLKEMSGIE